jgi:hypothetical protein
MKDFVDTVCNMQSNSINATVNDEMKKIYGTLVACLCDTLAAQWLGVLQKVLVSQEKVVEHVLLIKLQ